MTSELSENRLSNQDRDQEIVAMCKNYTLRSIGEKFDLSKQRIAQIRDKLQPEKAGISRKIFEIRSQEDVRNVFLYKDGELYWRVRAKGRGDINQSVGHYSKNGTCYINCGGKRYSRSQLVYLYHHGAFPEFIGRRDGNMRNDKIENLYETTRSEYMISLKKGRNANKLGMKYIYENKVGNNNYLIFKVASCKEIQIQKCFNLKNCELDDVIEFRDNWLRDNDMKRYENRLTV